ncbi:MAG: hypothetical protein ACXW4B_00045 [Micavibrio sp.]
MKTRPIMTHCQRPNQNPQTGFTVGQGAILYSVAEKQGQNRLMV